MNKKVKIAIGIIAVIILILIVINILKDNNFSKEVTTENTLSDVKYNEDTDEYYIYDEETGEILHTAETEEELYIYTIDPDYDSKMPASEENIENEIIE